MSKKLIVSFGSLVVFVVASLLLLTPKKSQSCGPWFQEALFTYTIHPQLPLDSFAAGRLGIIKPSFARSYLAVAYRHLMDKPLTKSEQVDAVDLWESRLSSNSVRSYSSFDSTLPNWDSISFEILPPYTNADSTPIENYTYQKVSYDEYTYFRSINPSAVQNATRRLLELAKLHGRKSEEVKDWIRSQRVVWVSHDSTALEPYDGENETIRVDRAYQVAASHFYAERYDNARVAFEKIAQDPKSPWRREGLYLAARAMVRKASLMDTVQPGDFKPALDLLARINDPTIATQKLYLQDYIYGWTRRDSQIVDLAKRLQDDDPANFEHELDDYTKLLDRAFGDVGNYYYSDEAKRSYEKLNPVLQSDDMTDWISTFESDDSLTADHASERWQKTKSMPWLIAALSKATSLHISYYIDMKPSSPAYESYVYYMSKLLHRAEDTEVLRPMLDAALATDLTRSGRNDLMRIRQDIATDLSDLVHMVARAPVGLTWSDGWQEMPDQDTILPVDYDADALRILNRSLPLTRLMEALDLKTLNGYAEEQLIMSAWSRAVLLDREDDAMRLSMKLLDHPILGPWMKRYRAAKPGIERHREGIFIHLKHPGLSPLLHVAPGRGDSIQNMDSYRDNGWCKLFTDSSVTDERDYGYLDRAMQPVALPFLTADDRTETEHEWRILAQASPSSNYLASEAVKWANASPNDRDVPEALHLAVRLSRYGCNDSKTGTYSKQAHTVLHKKYGKTKFAKATPYWFD